MSDGKKTILLVEDEALIALCTAQTLREVGYGVRVAHCGEEAVAIAFADEAIDLVLMDIDLGRGIDGTEAARRILAARRVPIVFLTSHAEREMVEKVRGITRYGYVIKDSGDFVLQSSVEMAYELFDAHERARKSEEALQRSFEDLTVANEELAALNQEFEASNEELRETNDRLLGLEASLRERDTFVTAVMDNLPIGIAVNSVDPAVEFSYMNDNFVRFYRTTREALADPDTFWEAVYEDAVFRQEMRRKVLEDCASGDPARMCWENVPIVRKGREVRYISARNVPIPDRSLLISTVWDVTERKRAEVELRRTNDYLDKLIQHANAPIIVWDPAFRVTRFNAAFARMTGFDADEVLGRKLSVLFPEESREASLDRIRDTLDGAFWESVEIPVRRKDGDVRFALWNSANILADDGKTLLATIAQGVDITDRKHAEEEARKLLREKELLLAEVHLTYPDKTGRRQG